MVLNGLYRWLYRRQECPEPASWQDGGAPALSSEGLALEKKWLQLARVDSDAFWVFFERYHDHLLAYLEWCTGDPDIAQDLTQEVFVYAIEHLDRFTWQGRSFGVWLFHIARRRVLPRYWRSDRRRAQEVLLGDQLDRTDPESPSDRLERAELSLRVRGLVERLPADRRDAIVLHIYMEYSLRDTALALGMPEETVRSHLARGRRQLAGWLRNEQALTDAELRSVKALLAEGQGFTAVSSARERRAIPASDREIRKMNHRQDRIDDED